MLIIELNILLTHAIFVFHPHVTEGCVSVVGVNVEEHVKDSTEFQQ